MDETFAAYAAGFFDGEGWVVIGLEAGSATRSDLHRIGVYVTQRARHREVLDRFQSRFGGTVTVRDTKIKGRESWAEQADWHIHTREQIERFCLAVQPYCIVKARQVAIALEFVTGFVVSPNVRDKLGRIRGRAISAGEVARRERLRVALKEVNAKGPERPDKIARPPATSRHRDRSQEALPVNTARISRGEHRPLARLTDEAVRAMRAEYAAGTITMDGLALRHGVTPAAIRMAIRRLTWRHVE